MKALIAALLATALAAPALAAPVNRYNVDITLNAVVTDVDVNGIVFAGSAGSGVEVRRFGYADLDRYAWNPGDTLTVRWRLEPFGDLGTCIEETGNLVLFGGFLGGKNPLGECETVPAVDGQLRRADGRRITGLRLGEASDGEAFEIGPAFNIETGEIVLLRYDNPDGHIIVPDCCDILYDPTTGNMISRSGTGFWSNDIFGVRPAGLGVHLTERDGEGIYMNSSFPDRTGGYEIWAHADLSFDTEWTVRVQAVPEPASTALVGAGLLALGLRRRWSRT